VSETKSGIISILLAIQPDYLRNSIKANLSLFDDIHIIDELDNIENLINAVKTESPEIVLISVNQRNSLVYDSIKTIITSYPGVSVITLLDDLEDDSIYTILGLGVSACITTGIQTEELNTCIRKVWNGENPIFDILTRPGIARLILNDMRSDLTGDVTNVDNIQKTLSGLESEILDRIADGDTLDKITSNVNISENEIIEYLTGIYGKLIFNNFYKFSTQPSNNSLILDQPVDENIRENESNTTVNDLDTPEENTESEYNINLKDILGEQSISIWEGFEVLNKELQETLAILSPGDDNPLSPEKESQEEYSDECEGDTDSITNTDKSLSIDIPESRESKNDDFDIIDQYYDSQLENIIEEMPSLKEDSIQNIESDIDQLAVNNTEENGGTQQDIRETAQESEVRENTEPVRQKEKWFNFSLKRNKKIASKQDNSIKNNDGTDDKSVNKKQESGSEKLPEMANKENHIPNKITRDDKDTTSIGRRDSREAILPSVKGLGVPVFINAPVGGKQLEKLESAIKHIESLTIILRKGTTHGHVLVIAGQNFTKLLKTLNDIPMIENATDEDGTINVKLIPGNTTDTLSQIS